MNRLAAVLKFIYQREWLLLALIFCAALTIRLIDLMQIPRFTDEGWEILWGLDILLGKHLPLTGVSAYYGPLYSYLLAGLFAVFGQHLLLPRLMIVVFNAAAACAAYGLGRFVLNRIAGLIGATLTVTCPALIGTISHLAFNGSLLPFFSTAAFAALYVGVERNKPWLLVLGALFAACMVQAHPVSAAALPGIGLWLLSRASWRVWLRRRVTYAALAAFFVGYAPMIVASLRPDGKLLSDAVNRPYAFVPTLNPAAYVIRLLTFLKDIFYIVGGGLPPNTLLSVMMALLTGGLLMIAWVVLWREQNRLLPLVLLSSVLIMPIFLVSFTQRYFSFFVPLAYVMLGALAARALQADWVAHTLQTDRAAQWLRRLRRLDARLTVSARSVVMSAGTLTLLLVVLPFYTLWANYHYLENSGQTNAAYFELVAELQARGACGAQLAIANIPADFDDALRKQSYFALGSFHNILTLDDCSHQFLASAEVVRWLADGSQPHWLIAPEFSAADYASQFSVQPIRVVLTAPVDTTFAPIGLYRIDSRVAQASSN